MFEIVEYASIILMSSWTIANSAPRMIEIAPSHMSVVLSAERSNGWAA